MTHPTNQSIRLIPLLPVAASTTLDPTKIPVPIILLRMSELLHALVSTVCETIMNELAWRRKRRDDASHPQAPGMPAMHRRLHYWLAVCLSEHLHLNGFPPGVELLYLWLGPSPRYRHGHR